MGGAAHGMVILLAFLVTAIVAGVTSSGNVSVGGRVAAFALVILFMITGLLVVSVIS